MSAKLSFLPWVREGAAAAITTVDAPTTPAQPAIATVAATVTVNGAPVPAVAVQLRGPADVLGIEANQVVRTDPQPGTHDFEPNCFASIEFDRPDFPWMFTPTKATASNQLRPWLCLVVVQKQAGVTLASTPDSPTSVLTIDTPAQPSIELPDLKDSWAWAHAQVAADDVTQQAVDGAFAGGPELTLSRLVCPRILVEQTDYIACVVPTFEVGRLAALGILTAADVAKKALAPAWVVSPAPNKVVLPVFHHWEFRTGERGDFESLARALEPSVPQGIGTRTVDVSQPGFPASHAAVVGLEGALMPIPPASATPPAPTPDPLPPGFKATLASIVDEPSRLAAADPTADPLLAPPTYGRWHAAKAQTAPTGASWFDQLNLDPRWRVAAAFGTRVVQEHQESLMASAWEQAAQLQTVNQRMRQMQLSMTVGEVLHRRHFSVLTEEMVLRIAAPAFGRLRHPLGRSMLANQLGTKLPAAANRASMRRIGRQRGPLTRRIAAKGAGFTRSATDTWVARLNEMWVTPPPPPIIPQPPALALAPMPPVTDWTTLLRAGQSLLGAFFVAPDNTTVVEPGAPVLNATSVEAPDFFRSAAWEHLDRFMLPRGVMQKHVSAQYQPVKQDVLAQMRPATALKALAGAIVATGDRVLAPTAAGVPSTGVETVMAAPYFPQPMYEPLRDLSQELLLPGLDRVAPETVLGLRTNRRFVESYLVGLNHEMGRELLWRGYPTDQRGTYFDRFWGNGVPNTAPRDITDLNTWNALDPATQKVRALGDAFGAPPIAEEFVMLLRSVLLKRYPNAVIYMTPAIAPPSGSTDPADLVPDITPAHEIPPIFSGSMKPDVAFFGFPVTVQAAIGGPGVGAGYYVVIQEHPTEPRYGIDEEVDTGTASHLVVGPQPPNGLALNGGTWNTNAAQMALVTRRLPVRVAIHASRLITPA